MSVNPASPTPVLLAVIHTDRPDAAARLLESLCPVAPDAGVHVVFFDNSASPQARTAVRALVEAASAGAAGFRRVVDVANGQPLHVARTRASAMAREVAARLGQNCVVWMLDDDLCFDQLEYDAGALQRRSVAVEHIAECRQLAVTCRSDLVIGAFTGDPPVRPDAVQANQLGDLAHALDRFASLAPDDPLPDWTLTPRTEDDYYDHAEVGAAHVTIRHAWGRRAWADRSVRAQFLALCEEASRIPSGSAPFRPLFAEPLRQLRETTEPRRGGNAIFLNVEALTAHSYPSIAMQNGWSRRSDMIGATLLCRSGYRVCEGGPQLLHDRTGQPAAAFDAHALIAEFAGVLVSRAVAGRIPAVGIRQAIGRAAQERAERVALMQSAAVAMGREALATLERPDVWWRREGTASAAAGVLAARLRPHVAALDAACTNEILSRLTDPEMLDVVAKFAGELLVQQGRGEACAGG